MFARWGAMLAMVACAQAAGNDALFLGHDRDGPVAFNQLVDGAEADLAAGRYERSLGEFQEADAMSFPEGPNFELLPAIAWLQVRLGKSGEAAQTLREGELVLSVLTGKAHCVENTHGWRLETEGPVAPTDFERVARRMCSVFLDDYVQSNDARQRAAFAGRLHLAALRLKRVTGDPLRSPDGMAAADKRKAVARQSN